MGFNKINKVYPSAKAGDYCRLKPTKENAPKGIRKAEVMKKKIGMILDVERPFPPDIRVEKEAKALINAGFEVSLLAKKVRSP
jgi:hypothetical protein